MAIVIFQGLLNSSTSGHDTSETMADIDESVNVLDVMARASGNVKLKEDVLPVRLMHLLSFMSVWSHFGRNYSGIPALLRQKNMCK